MPQESEKPDGDRVIVVHRAGSATEAVVIRSLLESAGIASPDPESPDMFPMREPPRGFKDTEILAFESEAEDVRRIIEEAIQTARSLLGATERSDAEPG
jgi:hypothetical protein